jgi:ATP-dependent protease Clp ATPase subunit
MLDIMYEVPMRGNARECVITRKVIDGHKASLGFAHAPLKKAG